MKNFITKIVVALPILLFSFQAAQSQVELTDKDYYQYWQNGIGHSS